MDWAKLVMANITNEDELFHQVLDLMQHSWGEDEESRFTDASKMHKILLFVLLSTTNERTILRENNKNIFKKKLRSMLIERNEKTMSNQDKQLQDFLTKNQSNLINKMKEGTSKEVFTLMEEMDSVDVEHQREKMGVSERMVEVISVELLKNTNLFLPQAGINLSRLIALIRMLQKIPITHLKSILSNYCLRSKMINDFMEQEEMTEVENEEKFDLKERTIRNLLNNQYLKDFVKPDYQQTFSYLIKFANSQEVKQHFIVVQEFLRGTSTDFDAGPNIDKDNATKETDYFVFYLSILYILNNLIVGSCVGEDQMTNSGVILIMEGKKNCHHGLLWSRPILRKRRAMQTLNQWRGNEVETENKNSTGGGNGMYRAQTSTNASGMYRAQTSTSASSNRDRAKIRTCYSCRLYQGTLEQIRQHKKNCRRT